VKRRRTPSDGKSSHCLWQGELIKKRKYIPGLFTKQKKFLFLIGRFLAHLAKGKVSFCHHLASIVRRVLTFHILIFSSETPLPVAAMFVNGSRQN
jgi:hypothetical protein